MSCMCGDTMCPSCGPAQGYGTEDDDMKEPYTGTADRYGTLGQQLRDDATEAAIEKRAKQLCRGTLMDMAEIIAVAAIAPPDALADDFLCAVASILNLPRWTGSWDCSSDVATRIDATACRVLRHTLEQMAERLATEQLAAERAAHEDRGHD